MASSKFVNVTKSIWQKILRQSDFKKAAIVCAIGVLVIILRRPELVLHPQFWAEDFAVFYRDEYILGIESLFKSYSGMLQTFPRIVSLLLSPLPMNVAPLAYNLVAIMIMVLPLFILWSDRNLLDKEGPGAKVILSILYLLLPNIGEIFGNLTNSLWFLAVASILILIRNDPKRKWLIFDSIVLAIAGLTGPFGPMLVVVALFLLWSKRSKGQKALWVKTAILIACSLVQLAIYANASQQRTASIYAQKRAIVDNYQKPIQITGMRFFALPIAGEEVVTKDDGLITEQVAEAPQMYTLGVFMLIFTVIGFIKSRLEIRALILFGVLIYGFSLARAQTVSVVQFWDLLQLNTFGGRYFFIPFIAWLVLLVSLAFTSKAWLRAVGAGLAVAYIVFFPFSFGIDKHKETHFARQAQAFEVLEKGQTLCFDINPDDAWKTCLKKH